MERDMRTVLLASLTLFLAACIESNPQPSPVTGGIEDRNQVPDKGNGGLDDVTVPAEDAFWQAPDQLSGHDLAAEPTDAMSEMLADAVGLDKVSDVVVTDLEPEVFADGETLCEDLTDMTHGELTAQLDTSWESEIFVDLAPADLEQEDLTSDVETTLSGGGTSFGMCWGACKQVFSIFNLEVHYLASGWDDAVYSDVTATLTVLGATQAKQVAVDLLEVSLDDVYGCPDCADGGAAHAQLLRKGTESKHAYPFNGPPPALETANQFIMSVLEAMVTCQSNDLVKIPEDCVPLEW
jgi:hypothetical protein